MDNQLDINLIMQELGMDMVIPTCMDPEAIVQVHQEEQANLMNQI